MKMLRARLYDLELQKRQGRQDAVEGAKMDIAWGSQIRCYVLQPYRMVKDHRTGERSATPTASSTAPSTTSRRRRSAARARGTLGQPTAVEDLAARGFMRRRDAARCLLLAAGGSALGCRGRQPKAQPAPAASDGAPSAFELVFERELAGNLDLYLIPAGGKKRRLTDDPAEDGLARFTPDGERIVFTSLRSGHYQIYEIPASGGPARPVRRNAATEYQADVSPDGKTLAFLSNLDGPERLLLQDLAGGGVRELVRHGSDTIFGNPHWSPDARFITFSSNDRIGHQIYVVEVATGSERRISPVTGGGCEPRFSRDGNGVSSTSAVATSVACRASSSTTSRAERSARSSRGRRSTTTPSTRPTAASSPSPRTSPASTRSTASGSRTAAPGASRSVRAWLAIRTIGRRAEASVGRFGRLDGLVLG